MIAGLVLTDGGPSLARHLANADDNERVEVRSAATIASDLGEALDELRLMTVGCRTRTPLVHAWASPRLVYSSDAWDRYWLDFEREFGLYGHPYVEVEHLKLSGGGRIEPHRHRVYVRLDAAGRAIPMSYSGLRLQKLSRVAEFSNGEPFTCGVGDRSVIGRLHDEGRGDVAIAMERAGLGVRRPKPAPSSAERAAAKRSRDFAADEVWRRAHEAWSTTTTGPEFLAALKKLELTLAMGDKAPVVVTPAGIPVPLRRAISSGAKLVGDRPIRKSELDLRLNGLVLEPWAVVGRRADFNPGPATLVRRDRRRPRELARPRPEDGARQPVLVFDAPPIAPVEERISPETAKPLPDLTPRQIQQLRAMADTPAEIEALVELEIAPKRRAERRRAQARAARAALKAHRALRKSDASLQVGTLTGLSSIVPAGFDAAAYKSRLAGVSDDIGSLLRWVDFGQDHRVLHLWSGAVVVTSPQAAIASVAVADAIPVMLAHAVAQGWTAITISSASDEWRTAVARAAAKAGFALLDDDLRAIAEDELQAMQAPGSSDVEHLSTSPV